MTAHLRTAQLLISFAFSAALAAGCSSNSTPSTDYQGPVHHTAQGIQGGTDDQQDPAVVGIVAMTGQGAAMCSGSLIAPNLVLTAHHCVAMTSSEAVNCKSTEFYEPFKAGSFYVTTVWDGLENFGGSSYYRVSDVWIPPWESSNFCGQDLALLRLTKPIPPTEALPIPPRVDEPVHKDEHYRAVGYGATSAKGGGAGHRRQRDGLHVVCADQCNGPAYDNEHEWGGSAGICSGDSGGPALDEQGRVIGVVSRGGNLGNLCTSPIYTGVQPWGDWLKKQAQKAADLGNYEPPRWVTGGSTLPETDAQVLVPEAGTADAAPDGPVHGTRGPGDFCSVGSDCASDVCVSDALGTKYCSEMCSSPEDDCPNDMVCNTAWGACMWRPETGTPCKTSWDCRSHNCLKLDNGERYCADKCSRTAPNCPAPATCDVVHSVCVLASEDVTIRPAGGCTMSASHHDSENTAMFLFAMAGLLAASRRTRRH